MVVVLLMCAVQFGGESFSHLSHSLKISEDMHSAPISELPAVLLWTALKL